MFTSFVEVFKKDPSKSIKCFRKISKLSKRGFL